MPHEEANVNQSPQPSQWTQASGYNPLHYIAKIPTYMYQAFRSAPGFKTLDMINEIIKVERPHLKEAQLFHAYASPEQARQEAAEILPSIMTQKLPLDWLAETAISELPIAAATGGLSSLKSLGRYAASAATGHLGALLGGALGETVGAPKMGAVAGGVLGGLVPGFIPSRYFKGKIPSLKNKKQLAEEFESIERQLPAEKQALEISKKNRIADKINVIEGYSKKIDNIKEKRTALYSKARQLEKGAAGNPGNLKEIFNKNAKPVELTLDDFHRNLFQDFENKLAQGTLPIADAKEFNHMLNDLVYRKNLPNAAKSKVMKIKNSALEFIERVGSPEHTREYKRANKASVKMFKAQKKLGDDIRRTNQEIRNIKGEKIPPTRIHDLKVATRKAQAAIKPSKYETLKQLMSSGSLIGGASGILSGILSSLELPYGLSTGLLGVGLGTGMNIYKQANIVSDVYKNHPAQFNAFLKELGKATPDTLVQTVARLNRIAQDIPITKTDRKKESKRGLFMPN